MARLSVRFHEVVIEARHVEVAARGPFAGGGVPDAGADEHERAPAVGEAARHAGATPDLAVEPFDHVVRADAPAAPVREPGQQAGRGPADPLPQAVGGGRQPPGLHLRGDGPGLVQRGFPGLHGEHGPQGRRRPFAVAGRRTLRMKCTMHRWYLASGSIEFTVETSPAHRAPLIGSLTPLRAVPDLLASRHAAVLTLSSVFSQVGVSCFVTNFFRFSA